MSLVLDGRAVPRLPGADLLRASIAHEVAYGRFTLWLPVLALAGIFVAVEVPFAVPPALLAATVATLLILRALAGRSGRFAILAAPLLALAAVATGAFALSVQERVGGTPVILKAQTVTLEGRIGWTESRGPGRQSLTVDVGSGTFRGPVPRKVRVSVRGDVTYRVGETIKGTARLFPLQGPVYPGGYDSSRRLFFDGIGATGFSYGPPDILAPPPRWSIRALIDSARTAVERRVTEALGADRAAFAAALLVGRRGAMDPADVDALRISGLGHILAISGLHMALVAGSVFAAVRFLLALSTRLALGAPIRKIAAVAGLLAASAYLALSGGSVATVRAFVMLAIALVAILADRPALTMRTVATAAVVVMALDPISVTEPSFQMSFLAVVALVGAYEWWGRRRVSIGSGWSRRTVAFVLGLAMTSLIAGLATAPASAYHFHRLAPLGLVANLLAMPVLTLAAMPAGVIAMLLMPFGLQAWPLAVMSEGLAIIIAIARYATEATGDGGVTGAVPAASAALSALGLLWLAIFTAPWRILGALAVVAGLALVPFAPRWDILVSEDAETVAARGPDGTLAFAGDADGFVATLWLKADGDPRAAAKDLVGTTCDALGCTLPLADGRLALPSSPRALADDCALAEAVVSTGVVTSCGAGLVVDRRLLARHGSVVARRVDGVWQSVPARPRGPVRRWQVPAEVTR